METRLLNSSFRSRSTNERAAVAVILTLVALTSNARAAEPVLVTRARTVWLAAPVALDEGIDETTMQRAAAALSEALTAAGAEVRTGDAAVLSSTDAGSPSVRLDRARGLLTSAEERYMAFEYGPAAASLAEAAGLFTVALAELPPADLEKLYRARLLEGLAWLEAGQPEAAGDAFKKLATIRPDFEPDPALMPPHARVLYQQAVGEVMALGTGVLEVRSQPPGAQVFVDGIPRGTTPLAVAGLPSGTHGLKVEHLGYTTVREEVTLEPRGKSERAITLTPTPQKSSLDRVRTSARRGDPPGALEEDLALLARGAGVDGIVLLGVASREGRSRVVTARLWTPRGSSAAIAKVGVEGVDGAAKSLGQPLLSSSWPAAQVHGDGVPLDADFTRSLLGIGEGFGREDLVSDDGGVGLLIWGGVGAGLLLAAAATAVVVAVVVTSGGSAPPPTKKVHVDLVF